MWEKIRVIFTIPELRKKIFFTLALLAVFRIGSHIPLPVFNQKALEKNVAGGGILDYVSAFSATNLGQATIFGLGIMPYISASIIFQLLGSVYPPLEKLQKEGETGRKKINEYTRYATVVLCLGQSWVYVGYMAAGGKNVDQLFLSGGSLAFSWQLICVLTATAGTIFLMWLGEQIDEYGIGNGISLLIMGGILARLPAALRELFVQAIGNGGLEIGSGRGKIGVEMLVILVLLFVGVILGVVLISQAQRRITTQSAKHVRGRRVFGGTRQYMALRVNQAGVMPIIFASSLLMFPWIAFGWLYNHLHYGWLQTLESQFHRGDSWVYNFLYVVLIYFFCYFWTAITFNPKDMADNLKNYGSFIPGYRPGRRTADYLEKVMVRITYVGAGFLAIVAIIPTIITAANPNINYTIAAFYGGTSLLIAVSVAFDLVQKIDSHLIMRNYKGLLD